MLGERNKIPPLPPVRVNPTAVTSLRTFQRQLLKLCEQQTRGRNKTVWRRACSRLLRGLLRDKDTKIIKAERYDRAPQVSAGETRSEGGEDESTITPYCTQTAPSGSDNKHSGLLMVCRWQRRHLHGFKRHTQKKSPWGN